MPFTLSPWLVYVVCSPAARAWTAMPALTKPMFPLRTGIAVQARAARRTDNVNQPRAKRERHVNDEARDWLVAAAAAPPTECAKKARGRGDTARVETRLP